MSRSNYDKPFYVDVGTSIAAIRCNSNHDIVYETDHHGEKSIIKIVKDKCDRMNQEAEHFYGPPGNAAAMREALISIRALIADEPDGTPMMDAMKATVEAALSAPPRNCDVGTPKEQGIRCLATMRHWRKAYQGDALITAIMKWAQMPYTAKEGETDGV